MSAPMLKFRVFPSSPRGLFAYVLVFDTWKDFDWWSRSKWQLPTTGRNFEGKRTRVMGRCVPYEVHTKDWKMLPGFADVAFCRKALWVDIMMHEIAHATHAWARRKRLLVDGHGDDIKRMEREELWAYAHGEMCEQLIVRLSREGLL